jgi:hypothetical protein
LKRVISFSPASPCPPISESIAGPGLPS